MQPVIHKPTAGMGPEARRQLAQYNAAARRLAPPPPVVRKIRIIDLEPAETAVEVTYCQRDVILVTKKAAEPGVLVFVGPKDRRLRIADIQSATCKFYGIKLSDVIAHRRPHNVLRARQVAMYLAKLLTSHSLPEIGRRFDRDHTSIMHTVRKIEGLIGRDIGLTSEIDHLKAILTREVD